MSEDTPIAPEEEPLTEAAVLAMIEECRGNISAIARNFGRRRNRMKEWIDQRPEMVQAIKDWREEILDKAEDNIFASVEKGDLSDSRFMVATLGKDRGWVPRAEQTGKDGTDLIPPQIIFAQYEDEPEADAATEEATAKPE